MVWHHGEATPTPHQDMQDKTEIVGLYLSNNVSVNDVRKVDALCKTTGKHALSKVLGSAFECVPLEHAALTL